ncbi:MAG TPA: hypothetical protein VJI69_07430, partial [Bacteroidia bacterium]|nr:hypothetical protein [Bacteroidia bacterium]
MLKFLRFKHKTLAITKEDESFSFAKYSWKQFRKNKAAFWSLVLLMLWVFIALLAPVIANEKPLYCIYKGNKLYPAFSSKEIYELTDATGKKTETISLNNFDWKRVEYEKVVWAYCAYSPGKSDVMNTIVAPGGEQVFKKANEELIVMPGKFKHRMGTTKDGGDVLAGL